MTTSDDKDDIDIFWYCKKYVGKNSREKKKIKNIKFLMLGSDTWEQNLTNLIIDMSEKMSKDTSEKMSQDILEIIS